MGTNTVSFHIYLFRKSVIYLFWKLFSTLATFQFSLPSTPTAVRTARKQKKNEIWNYFYSTDALNNCEWMWANYLHRHLLTRLAVNGFHPTTCVIKLHHVPCDNCTSALCGEEFNPQDQDPLQTSKAKGQVAPLTTAKIHNHAYFILHYRITVF